MDNRDVKKLIAFEILMTKNKYESELKRQDSLIQQAGNMQSAFAFTTAALFMAVPVMFQYRGVLSFEFIYIGTSIITSILLFSLFAATMAQNRKKQDQFPDGEMIIEYIEDKEEEFSDDNARNKYIANTYSEVQKSLTSVNEKRVFWVRISMWSFYMALGFCVLWFLLSATVIFGRRT